MEEQHEQIDDILRYNIRKYVMMQRVKVLWDRHSDSGHYFVSGKNVLPVEEEQQSDPNSIHFQLLDVIIMLNVIQTTNERKRK